MRERERREREGERERERRREYLDHIIHNKMRIAPGNFRECCKNSQKSPAGDTSLMFIMGTCFTHTNQRVEIFGSQSSTYIRA